MADGFRGFGGKESWQTEKRCLHGTSMPGLLESLRVCGRGGVPCARRFRLCLEVGRQGQGVETQEKSEVHARIEA